MDRYFTRTFYRFLFGFLAIIVVAFSVLVVLGLNTPKELPPVDNAALSQ
jgi:hypothetical protein